jgi:hypothetical protein
MKTKNYIIIYIIIAFSSLVLIWVSCSKDSDVESAKIQINQPPIQDYSSSNTIDKQLAFYYAEYQNTNKSWVGNIWRWIIAHAGTSQNPPGTPQCGGTNSCGPCPGFCVNGSKSSDLFIPVEETYVLTTEMYANGERLLQIALFNDTIMGMTFVQSDFVSVDSLIISDSLSIGNSASSLFNKSSITILPGAYPVSFTHSRNGSTIVNVRSN